MTARSEDSAKECGANLTACCGQLACVARLKLGSACVLSFVVLILGPGSKMQLQMLRTASVFSVLAVISGKGTL